MLNWQTCQWILLSHLVHSQISSSAINSDIAISQSSSHPLELSFFRSLAHRVYPCILSMAFQWSVLFPLQRRPLRLYDSKGLQLVAEYICSLTTASDVVQKTLHRFEAPRNLRQPVCLALYKNASALQRRQHKRQAQACLFRTPPDWLL